jgi:hypothetical protein
MVLMSQYRDDRDAARLRIAELEAQLAEQEATLSAHDVAVTERDAEIARLRHRLVLSGILGHRARPVHVAWASRLVVLACAVAGAALAVGVVALRAPRPVIVEVVQAPGAAPVDPILADPALLPPPAPVVVEDAPAAADAPPSTSPDEAALRRQLEPRVFGGRASVDEIRMLKALCGHQGDRACRDRAAALLPRTRSSVF